MELTISEVAFLWLVLFGGFAAGDAVNDHRKGESYIEATTASIILFALAIFFLALD
jgi:hypothetical protein